MATRGPLASPLEPSAGPSHVLGTVRAVDADALLVGLDPDQRAAVVTDAAPLAVLAGAGAGKTRVLTRRIAWRAATGPLHPERVLALTFTRPAPAPLRS